MSAHWCMLCCGEIYASWADDVEELLVTWCTRDETGNEFYHERTNGPVSVEWKKRFRSVYFLTSGDGSTMTDAQLSGVGCFHPTLEEFVAPVDQTAELSVHDDPNGKKLFRILSSGQLTSDFSDDGILLAHAFLLHCACWEVLVACNGNKIPSPSSVLKILASFKEYLPNGRHCSSTTATAALLNQLDPFIIPMITRVLDRFKDPSYVPNSSCLLGHADFFGLPEHIMQQILVVLPSGDVQNLRLASRAWASIQLRNPFWASRFHPGHEFQHILEARGVLTWQNWRDTFFFFKSKDRVLHIQKRNLVYDRACDVLGWLKKLDNLRCEGRLPRDDGVSEQWAGVNVHSGDILSHGAFKGLFTALEAEIPPDLEALFVSRISVGAKSYLSGIRMQCSSGLDICLGYIGEESQLLGNDARSGYPRKQTLLYGLRLSVNQTGIRGLAIVSCYGVPFTHVGCFQDLHDDTLHQTGLLSTGENGQLRPIRAIRCKMDSLKITALSISTGDDTVFFSDSPEPTSMYEGQCYPARESAQFPPELIAHVNWIGQVPHHSWTLLGFNPQGYYGDFVAVETIIDPIGMEPSGLSSEAPFIKLKAGWHSHIIDSLEISVGTRYSSRMMGFGHCHNLRERSSNYPVTPQLDQIGQLTINPLGDTRVTGFKTLFSENLRNVLPEGYQE